MNRNGTSILTGTLLLSMLFSPAIRSTPETAETSSQLERKHGSDNSTYSKSGGYELSTSERKHIQEEAASLYRHGFDEVVEDECSRGEVKSDEKPSRQRNKDADQSGSCKLSFNNFVIALLPDPARTHLALQFDRSIEAIQEALQDEHYLFVRSTMPWDPNTHPESDDHAERESTELAEEAEEAQPGLMVFRAQQHGDPSPLLVLVVGEAPTGGINKVQFRNAVVEMKRRIRPISPHQQFGIHQPDEPGLRILGPTFSGSLASLGELLTCKGRGSNDVPCYPLVSVHSGTASSYEAVEEFDAHAASRNTYFVSFQESDAVMIERFKEFLTGDSYGDRHYDPSRIVLLSEDETAYGTLSGCSDRWRSKDEGDNGHRHKLDTTKRAYRRIARWFWPRDSHSDSTDDEQNYEEPPCPLTIYFPREISQLRTAYQKDVASTLTSGQSIPRDILPSYSDVPGSDDDTVAPFSGHQMPLSQEGIMLGIVSELKKQNAQFVLVRATDPMDTLFLVRYLRTAYPQATMVTLGADMLYRREAENPHFHGLLALSTYSLSTTANQGFADYEYHHIERVFPSNSEAATYNAMRSLLFSWVQGVPACLPLPSKHTLEPDQYPPAREPDHCRQQLVTLSPREHPLELYQYGWRQQQSGEVTDYSYDAPPVRLLVLGRDQFWQLASLGPYKYEPHESLLPRARRQLVGSPPPIEIPNSWRAVQLVGLALAVFYCWSLLSSSLFSSLQPFAKFAPAVPDRRFTLILVAGTTLFLILLILMWPAIHGAKNTGFPLEPLLLVSLFAVFATMLSESFDRALATNRPRPYRFSVPKESPLTALSTPEFLINDPMPVRQSAVEVLQVDTGGAAVALRREYMVSSQPAFKSVEELVPPLPAAEPRSHREVSHNIPSKTLGHFAQIAFFALGCLLLLFGATKGEHAADNMALVRWYTTLRTIQLTSGLSFIMPTFFFLTVWLWWAEHLSSGYALLDGRRPRLPKGMKQQRLKPLLPKSLPELYATIKPHPYSFVRYLIIAVLVSGSALYLMRIPHPIMTLEKPLLEGVMTFLLLLAFGGIIATTVHLWDVWIGIRRLLVQLDMHPLRDGFKTIKGFSWKPIWRFGSGGLPEFLRIFARELEALQVAVKTLPSIGDAELGNTASIRDRADQAKKIKRRKVKPWWSVRKYFHRWFLRREAERRIIAQFKDYQKVVAIVAGRALDFLASRWNQQKEEKRYSALDSVIPYLAKEDGTANRVRQLNEKEQLEVQACERFVCIAYVSFILTALVRLRSLIVAVGGMYVLTLIAIGQYPFEPKGELQLLLVVLLGGVVWTVGLVFAQVHRDTILSNLTDTNPGELGIDFYVRMASFVALPLFSLLASQFPSVNRFFYSWLQPAVEALNR